ncbi:transmembrane protein 186 [Ascaphus truei]|uniref:transmembrane protein 186 n=1 Tax=Ascaphus truei TaxID=8439 RepID=UPI003F5982BD
MAGLCAVSLCYRSSSYVLLPLQMCKSRIFCTTSCIGSGKILQPRGSEKASHPYLLHVEGTPQWVPSNTRARISLPQQEEICDPDKFTLIYKFPGIWFCRSLSRLKLLQTTVTMLLLPPVYYFYLQGQVSYACVVYCSGTAILAGTMLYCLTYYLRRIIGMIYLNGAGTTLKVSHLTFWGKRRDIFIPVEDVKTLAETGDGRHETLLQFRRYSSSDVLYFTTKFGRILDRERFIMLFGEFK